MRNLKKHLPLALALTMVMVGAAGILAVVVDPLISICMVLLIAGTNWLSRIYNGA